MATRLYPPLINGTIPAFYGATLVVPFSFNRAVSVSDIVKMVLKIKTVNGDLKETVETTNIIKGANPSATFELTAKYSIGQHYKIQLAFKDKDENVGYYSTVGVVKYTTLPTVIIDRMNSGVINSHNYYYTGVYSQERTEEYARDTSEKLYSSRFVVYDSSGNIVDDTGERLHNTSSDTKSYEAIEEYYLARDLDENESFSIQFIAKTSSGMEVPSRRYRISQKRSVPPEAKFDFKATMDEDNGFVKLTIENCSQLLLSGSFLISRRSNLEGDTVWSDFKNFTLHAIQPKDFLLIDCSVAHGVKYTYAIQQYNQNNLYSEKIISNELKINFEDAFLYDGEKQLRIRYNPKISSFKTDLAEQKTETIGSQHPFIIRNGNVAYKEFPISGLISYQSDTGVNMFMTNAELGIKTPSFNLTPENMAAERIFKMQVLDWLNNGKPKLFRSPAEGNFIVRLMNVSLSPTDALGRMLHTFSATAYEIANFSPESLAKFNIVNAKEQVEEQTQWSTVDLHELTFNPNDNRVKVNTQGNVAYSVKFTDMQPGSMVYLNNESIMIGVTGSYSAASEKGFSDICVSTKNLSGLCTYEYKARTVSMFGKIDNLEIRDVPVRQFIGTRDLNANRDVFETIEDTRTQVVTKSLVRFIKRPINYVYVDVTDSMVDSDNNVIFKPLTESGIQVQYPVYKFFMDMDCTEEVDFTKLDPSTIYQIRLRRRDYRNYNLEGYYVDRNTTFFAPYTEYYIDGYYSTDNNKGGTPSDAYTIFRMSEDMFDIDIDGEIVSVKDTEKFKLESPSSFKSIKPNNGVITEVGYSAQLISYSFEISSPNVIARHRLYNDALNKYSQALKSNASYSSLRVQYTDLQDKYNNYLKALDDAIEDYKKEAGLTGEGGLI